jgi:Bacterial Ig domain
MPGQQLTYAIQVANYDVGCNSSSFAISVSAPNGFSVSIPTSTVSLRSSKSEYLWAYVTSPTAIANGDYPLTVTVTRTGTSGETSSFTSFYKVYSVDTTAPNLFWPNPAPGQTISGSSVDVGISASDDHAVRKLDLYVDGAHVSSTACDNVSYTCQLNHRWRAGAPASTPRGSKPPTGWETWASSP